MTELTTHSHHPLAPRVMAVLSCAVCARIYYNCALIVGEGESGLCAAMRSARDEVGSGGRRRGRV
eukprot:scaffold8346_cov119-Isochrysis_galbana.AAC.9